MRTPHFEKAIDEAVRCLQRGGVVAYPTDTLYGLGADIFSPMAVERVYALKGRPQHMALPVLLASVGDLSRVAMDIPETAYLLVARYWPGPLTLVLRRHPRVSDFITAGRETVAVRVPGHDVPVELCRRLGGPITGTSANRSGGPSPVTADDVRNQLGADVDCIIDGGPSAVGQASTILDLTVDPPVVLRLGAVSLAELGRVMGTTVRGPAAP